MCKIIEGLITNSYQPCNRKSHENIGSVLTIKKAKQMLKIRTKIENKVENCIIMALYKAESIRDRNFDWRMNIEWDTSSGWTRSRSSCLSHGGCPACTGSRTGSVLPAGRAWEVFCLPVCFFFLKASGNVNFSVSSFSIRTHSAASAKSILGEINAQLVMPFFFNRKLSWHIVYLVLSLKCFSAS